MKIFLIMAFTLFMSGFADARSSTSPVKLDVIGETLPAIRHVNDMKISADTLFFVYEGEDGYGQRLLRRAVVDLKNRTLNVSPDMGKREDGYYVSYMPYPFIADNGSVRVVSQDDCEIFRVGNDTVFVRTGQSLIDGNSTVPFPLSRYVRDIFTTGPDRYVFIGREPDGGRQFAMTSDLTSSKIDTIRQINISPVLQAWMPNIGELAYSGRYNRFAFAYKLHPAVEIFGIDGAFIRSVRIGKDSFDPSTLEEADFDNLCILHTVDLTYTPRFIYALYWGFRFADSATSKTTILKIDWNGEVIERITGLPVQLSRIAAADDSRLIGWDGNDFLLIPLR